MQETIHIAIWPDTSPLQFEISEVDAAAVTWCHLDLINPIKVMDATKAVVDKTIAMPLRILFDCDECSTNPLLLSS